MNIEKIKCEVCGKVINGKVYYYTETRGQIWTGKYFIGGRRETDRVCKPCCDKLNKRRDRTIKLLGWIVGGIILVIVILSSLVVISNK